MYRETFKMYKEKYENIDFNNIKETDINFLINLESQGLINCFFDELMYHIENVKDTELYLTNLINIFKQNKDLKKELLKKVKTKNYIKSEYCNTNSYYDFSNIF